MMAEVDTKVGDKDAKHADQCTVDLVNRDPEKVNAHLKVEFEECFAEPHESIFSLNFVWSCSHTTFRNTKLWCYRILTLLCAVPLAFIWGICFACISCNHIWVFMPCYRAYSVCMGNCKLVFDSLVSAFLQPCYTAASYLFSNIHVTMRKE